MYIEYDTISTRLGTYSRTEFGPAYVQFDFHPEAGLAIVYVLQTSEMNCHTIFDHFTETLGNPRWQSRSVLLNSIALERGSTTGFATWRIDREEVRVWQTENGCGLNYRSLNHDLAFGATKERRNPYQFYQRYRGEGLVPDWATGYAIGFKFSW
jgi:hypothetical protein